MGYYDDIAEGYEELHREEQESKLKLIRENMPFSEKGMKLLDIGCGTGISMEGWDCEVAGIDPSPKLLEIARSKGLNAVQGKPNEMPFADEEFDVVISLTSLHHVDFPNDVAKEISRVCKTWFIMSYLKGASLIHRQAMLEALAKHFKKEKVLEHEKDVIYFFRK